MVILKNYLRQNLIQISTKNAPNDTIFSKFSWGSMPPNPALSADVLSLYKKRPHTAPPYDTPLPHSKCTVTIIIVLYIIKINYLLILYIKKWTKSDQTIHQNTPNCIIYL